MEDSLQPSLNIGGQHSLTWCNPLTEYVPAYAVGEKVEGHECSGWAPGRVTSINDDGTYDVLWENETPAKIEGTKLRKVQEFANCQTVEVVMAPAADESAWRWTAAVVKAWFRESNQYLVTANDTDYHRDAREVRQKKKQPTGRGTETWQCSRCTLLNQSFLDRCKACRSPRNPRPASGGDKVTYKVDKQSRGCTRKNGTTLKLRP